MSHAELSALMKRIREETKGGYDDAIRELVDPVRAKLPPGSAAPAGKHQLPSSVRLVRRMLWSSAGGGHRTRHQDKLMTHNLSKLPEVGAAIGHGDYAARFLRRRAAAAIRSRRRPLASGHSERRME
jgi:hypothetical protein